MTMTLSPLCLKKELRLVTCERIFNYLPGPWHQLKFDNSREQAISIKAAISDIVIRIQKWPYNPTGKSTCSLSTGYLSKGSG
jgi:hypothetical protein